MTCHREITQQPVLVRQSACQWTGAFAVRIFYIGICLLILISQHFTLNAQLLASYPNGIAAVVQQYVITYDDLRQELGRIRNEDEKGSIKGILLAQYGRNRTLYVQKMQEATLEALERLIENKLILLDFEEEGYNLPESIIEERIEERIAREYDNRRDSWIRTLMERGETIEMEKQRIREQIIVDWMRYSKTSEIQIVVSPVVVNAYYDANLEEFYQVEQLRYRTITIRKPKDPKQEAAKKALIMDIEDNLKSGSHFPEMAAIYSEDEYKDVGGEHPGWANRKETLREDLAEIVFALDVGEVSEIVENSDSWQLFQVFERKPEGYRPLQEVRPEIENQLETKERRRLEQQWINRLKRKYHVMTQDSSSGANQGGGVSLLPFGLSELFPAEFR